MKDFLKKATLDSSGLNHVSAHLMVQARGYSSVVEHSTADREVPGSNPGVPYNKTNDLFCMKVVENWYCCK